MNDGDVELKGKTGTYVINVGTNAMCRLEELTDKSYVDVLAELQTSPRMTTLRQFMKAALVTDVSLEEAGAVMDDVGGVDVIAATMARRRAIEQPVAPQPVASRRTKRTEAA